MFEELEDEENVDVSPDSPDRLIVYAIWKKSDSLSLTPEEAWAILHERYPDDARFLLLNAYAELAEPTVAGAWTPSYFVKKVERISTSGSTGSAASRSSTRARSAKPSSFSAAETPRWTAAAPRVGLGEKSLRSSSARHSPT